MRTIPTIVVASLGTLAIGALGACGRAHPDGAVTRVTDKPSAPEQSGFQPSFGEVVRRNEAPPPISGGTLAVAADHMFAAVADPDRDRVYVVDLASGTLARTVELPKHSEPGRVIIDDAGRAYVALRRSGGLVTIDLASGTNSTRDVCTAPRGLAFEQSRRVVHVACASGELVTLSVDGGREPPKRALPHDLRDIVLQNDGSMLVTTFRSASMIRVWDAQPLVFDNVDGSNLAWRAISVPPDDPTQGCVREDCVDATAMVLQLPTPEPVGTTAGSYVAMGGASDDFAGNSCSVASGIITTRLKLGTGSIRLPEAVLPVDLASNGRDLAVVAAGNAYNEGLAQIFVVSASDVRHSEGGCVPTVRGNVPGQAVAAAFGADDVLLVQTREPAALHIMAKDRHRPVKTISLAADSVADTGHAIFHANAGGFIACASCHAEGADDGHVWSFVAMGPRRTPTLLGTIADTEPFHWDGDQKNFRDLVDHVFVERMGGPAVDDDRLEALRGWLYAQPAPAKLRPATDDTAAGKALFEQRCTSCHAGSMLTNNETVDVGTGGAFQVPSLVGVGWRQSFMHTGCAHTLADRFNPKCGGNKHGATSDLSADQITSLLQFLETL